MLSRRARRYTPFAPFTSFESRKKGEGLPLLFCYFAILMVAWPLKHLKAVELAPLEFPVHREPQTRTPYYRPIYLN